MPKGKKFDAAQKHFEKRQAATNRLLSAANDRILTLENENSALKTVNVSLQEQLDSVTEKLLALEAASKLTPEQLTAYINETRRKNDATGTVKAFVNMASQHMPFSY